MMQEKIPIWETELWSNIGMGNGESCPLRNSCLTRRQIGQCLDDFKENVSHLLESREFNPGDYDILGSPMCGRMHELMEKLALYYIGKVKLRRLPVPQSFISAITDSHVEIRPVPLKSYHGAVWQTQDGWVIHINENDPEDRRRFTLFHEIFHILAHCKTVPVFKKRDSGEGSFNETMADCFALCITMPESWIRKEWTRTRTLDRIAEIFRVPVQAVYIRLKGLGLI